MVKQYQETHSNHTGAALALMEGCHLPSSEVTQFTPIFSGISNSKL